MPGTVVRIEPDGLTVRDWPHRSVRLPLAKVARFDTVSEAAWVGGDGTGVPGLDVDRLAVITVDGERFPVSRATKLHACGWGLSAAACALRLNNGLADRRRPPSGRTAAP